MLLLDLFFVLFTPSSQFKLPTELPSLYVSLLTVPQLSRHDSYTIEITFVLSCLILNVLAVKMFYDCFTCLRNWPTVTLEDTPTLVPPREMALEICAAAR